jgi:hypothetical protein
MARRVRYARKMPRMEMSVLMRPKAMLIAVSIETSVDFVSDDLLEKIET